MNRVAREWRSGRVARVQDLSGRVDELDESVVIAEAAVVPEVQPYGFVRDFSSGSRLHSLAKNIGSGLCDLTGEGVEHCYPWAAVS